ncbi:hypothetical protein BB561_003460 [Smittium simulii]|uniref:CCHC-type domain-containing protein n=1 Tax=Smittium simulii TaxID=133385 RepID=A0A2T9YLB3_9FUNG|nr:hypothetical protein BB561_003460 [Smittium simulii]
MSNVPGVIPSAAAGVHLIPTKRTRLEYSTVAKTGYIDPATKNDYNFNFPAKNNQNNQNNQKNQKNTKNQKKNEKFEKFQQNNKNNVSIMHLLDNSIPKALKKACYGGSNTKIGCSWTQFSGNINAAIDYVALKIDNEYIDDEYVSYQHDSKAKAKATYFMFYNEERAEKCMNTPIYYNGIAVELYQTVTLEEGTQIITIPNTNSLNIIKLVEAVNNTFTKNGIIYDFSAYKNKNNGKFHTFGVKFLFKKTIYSFEIPTFLEIDKFVLALNYSGCKPVCSFCKQQRHWRSECPELQNLAKTMLNSKKMPLKMPQNVMTEYSSSISKNNMPKAFKRLPYTFIVIEVSIINFGSDNNCLSSSPAVEMMDSVIESDVNV